MNRTNELFTLILVAPIILLGHPHHAWAQAQAELQSIDDFEDGDLLGWTRWDRVEGTAAGPPIYDATSGECRLATTGFVQEGGGDISLTWDDSSDPEYSEGYWRVRVRANSPGTAIGIWLRGTGVPAFTYQFFANLEFGFGIERFGPYRFMGFLPGASFGLGEDWFMECGTVGETISLKVWREGEEEPIDPQLVLTDNAHSVGQFSLYTFAFRNAQVDATFDDVSFRPARHAIVDCNDNGVDDSVDLAQGTSADCNHNGTPDSCDLENGIASDVNGNLVIDDCEPHFLRGDCNDDGDVDISDATCALNWLFLGGPAPGCLASADMNTEDSINITDATYLLNFLFLGGPPLPPPYPDCGISDLASDEALGCLTPPEGCR